MASINVGEDDFKVLANAACAARDDGDMDTARALDKLARKVNAALSSDETRRSGVQFLTGKRTTVRWQDMPSTLDPAE